MMKLLVHRHRVASDPKWEGRFPTLIDIELVTINMEVSDLVLERVIRALGNSDFRLKPSDSLEDEINNTIDVIVHTVIDAFRFGRGYKIDEHNHEDYRYVVMQIIGKNFIL